MADPNDIAPIEMAAASGNKSIDGLLMGRQWDGPITYSAPNSLSDFGPVDGEGYFTGAGLIGSFNTSGFSGLNAQQLAAYHFALKTTGVTAGFSVSGFTDLDVTFLGGGSGLGIIRAANMADASPTAYAFYPHATAYGGDIFFGTSKDDTSSSLKTPQPGNWAWHTMLHETGHALGLKHGHEAAGGFAPLPANVDSLEFTVMTYRTHIGQSASGYTYEKWGAPQTYMMLDIAALQYLYGADFTANAGDTVYEWRPGSGRTWIDDEVAISPVGNRIFATIWDGGGVDTYDLSAYASDVTIGLRPSEGSVFSKTQLAYLGGGPNDGYARANIFNALQYDNDPRSLIENATGGSGNDKISGNRAANMLTGNGSNDTLNGRSGNDTLIGSAGNDTLKGASDDDVLDGGKGSDTASYKGANKAVTVNLSIAGPQDTGGTGTDTLISIENIIGGNGKDTLTGNSGKNKLMGGTGHDKLYGEGGNDRLDGGPGKDILTGGDGADYFDFNAIKDSVKGSKRDQITDFKRAQGDKIDLKDIDANTKKSGDQKFKFIGDDKFSKTAGELRFDKKIVQGDVNGDGKADFEIHVNVSKLAASDFFL